MIWSADPYRLLAHLLPRQVGLIVPVAPYGRPLPQEGWSRLEAQTGIPIVIDSAAGLEALVDDPARYIGPIPAVLIFHATKVFAPKGARSLPPMRIFCVV